MTNRTREIVMFGVFERLWHWTQATLIILLLITGFEVHGSYSLIGFGPAANLHVYCAIALIVVWVFAIFWHVATGEWRQYVPTTRRLAAVVRFYAVGIFRGESHPFKPRPKRKHNPLQALAYLAFNAIISPVIWASGLIYLAADLWDEWVPVSLTPVALIHTAAAFAVAVFLVAHVYMITTGRTPTQHLKAMITGRETVAVEDESEHHEQDQSAKSPP